MRCGIDGTKKDGYDPAGFQVAEITVRTSKGVETFSESAYTCSPACLAKFLRQTTDRIIEDISEDPKDDK